MKNLFLSLAFMLIGTFAFAGNTVERVNYNVQECAIKKIKLLDYNSTQEKDYVCAVDLLYSDGSKKSVYFNNWRDCWVYFIRKSFQIQ